jgi:hypothetical protein
MHAAAGQLPGSASDPAGSRARRGEAAAAAEMEVMQQARLIGAAELEVEIVVEDPRWKRLFAVGNEASEMPPGSTQFDGCRGLSPYAQP